MAESVEILDEDRPRGRRKETEFGSSSARGLPVRPFSNPVQARTRILSLLEGTDASVLAGGF
jgi:hypothetical protein